ncbi:uncharacterized protein LACBIDRAFT_299683 [Laccaria bicolor S238N-H82]|uniref:Predicted protein n=1 Tax=Laccaria bicolor (strain S238N-H82 / ATCC MYA-4686) TaxID=486041 RepID=B0DF62_LACBS|nr:uncharacterized protein LACBIDRAFT_299683 [Laccaria bicolor S238N-H82]EDR06658.1 predicted protein [Laccaria bicolor S238N-H82]|eukprot:XP_001882505.1 predicted protein [Laccaria bicolor S238N-H82]
MLICLQLIAVGASLMNAAVIPTYPELPYVPTLSFSSTFHVPAPKFDFLPSEECTHRRCSQSRLDFTQSGKCYPVGVTFCKYRQKFSLHYATLYILRLGDCDY